MFALAACSTSKPPLAVMQAPISTGHTSSEVEQAILTWLEGRGWKVKERTPGGIVANIDVRARHFATIAVTYSGAAFSIDCVDSTGLEYDAEKKTIHGNYNRWVANLRDDINLRL